MGTLGSHTPGAGSPHLRLSQAGHPEVAEGGQDLPGLCQGTHGSVVDTWGLLSDRTFQNSQIKPPKLCWSIYIHLNKLGLKVVIFKLVEQAGGEV